MVARDRRTSLSQAAEYLIEQQFREYEVDGVKASKVVAGVVEVFADNLQKGNPLAINASAPEQLASLVLSSPVGRSFFMPESLLSPSERYFKAVYGELLARASSSDESGAVTSNMVVLNALANPELLEHFNEKAKAGEQRGLSPAEVAEEIQKELASEIAATDP
ncbi:hypothetical protein DBR34_04815 [Stenotrophomonas sp. HMWF003]|nr:hypothetical protein DBR34_04815 [Stenotrophomonas sp. HMWF003]